MLVRDSLVWRKLHERERESQQLSTEFLSSQSRHGFGESSLKEHGLNTFLLSHKLFFFFFLFFRVSFHDDYLSFSVRLCVFPIEKDWIVQSVFVSGF